MRKLFIILGLLPVWLFAQNHTAELNPFIEFNNESVHGMLIIHRMLENFNQQLNKYVDLESTQVNFYGNDDLPRNIFHDEDHFFYDTTPMEWLQICKKKVEENPKLIALSDCISGMVRTTEELNQLRFDLQSLINTLDLDKSQNQKIIYKKLARGEALYAQFYDYQKTLREGISKMSATDKDPLASSLSAMYRSIESIFQAIRAKKTNEIPQLKKQLAEDIKLIPQGAGAELTEVINLATNIVNDLETYLTQPEIEGAYKQYGYFYYYHNVRMINKVNRYGNGLAYFTNEILKKKKGHLLVMEIPHYFKVIYPKKEEVTPYVASSQQVVDQTPDKLEKRLVINNEQKILVDNHQVDFSIFDHKEQDGDVLSLNFNGDWVLENHALTNKPYHLKLSLNQEGKNYLVLHAVNTGSRPPNTVAVSYYYKGKREQIILNSDLEHSEMIEIDIDARDN